MTYTISIAPRAERQLTNLFKKIPKHLATKIAKQIDVLAENPRPNNVKKLEGSANFYRVDVQDYRIVYVIEDKVLTVLILKVAHRKEVYSKKLKI